MKWLHKKFNQILNTEIPLTGKKEPEAPTKPLYYSVTQKKIEWVDNFGSILAPGQRYIPGWFTIQAYIFHRDQKEKIATVSVHFEEMKDDDKAIQDLQDKIQVTIKKFLRHDACIAKLYQADIINNGLEWFIT